MKWNRRKREPHRDWTQVQIIYEARRRYEEEYGSFDINTRNFHSHRTIIAEVCDEAFGGVASCFWESGWRFPMRHLTVGELLRFFAKHEAAIKLKWCAESWNMPHLCVVMDDKVLAEKFLAHFEGKREPECWEAQLYAFFEWRMDDGSLDAHFNPPVNYPQSELKEAVEVLEYLYSGWQMGAGDAADTSTLRTLAAHLNQLADQIDNGF